MNLVILDQFSDPGGAQQALLDVLPAMRARGWQALAGLPGGGAVFDRVRALGFDAERIACGPFRSGRKSIRDTVRFLCQIPRLSRRIGGMVRRSSAALVYANGPRILPAVPAGLPVVFHAHSFIGPGAVRELVGWSLCRTGARLIANCEFVAHPWRRFVPAERIAVIYNGVAGAACRPAARAAEEAPTIACIGRIAPEKGQLAFVQAAAIIHRALPKARFQIAGAPLFGETGAAQYDRRVRTAAAGLPIDFRGWVGDVDALLAGIDLLLVPSAPHEATTRVILESYAAGVPVIAFRSGGIPEVIEEGRTGHLAGSPEEMAALAIDLLRSPSRHAAMSQAAQDCWRRRFTLERHRRELLSRLEIAAGKADAEARRNGEIRGEDISTPLLSAFGPRGAPPRQGGPPHAGFWSHERRRPSAWRLRVTFQPRGPSARTVPTAGHRSSSPNRAAAASASSAAAVRVHA